MIHIIYLLIIFVIIKVFERLFKNLKKEVRGLEISCDRMIERDMVTRLPQFDKANVETLGASLRFKKDEIEILGKDFVEACVCRELLEQVKDHVHFERFDYIGDEVIVNASIKILK